MSLTASGAAVGAGSGAGAAVAAGAGAGAAAGLLSAAQATPSNPMSMTTVALIHNEKKLLLTTYLLCFWLLEPYHKLA